jgi:hypothetical protein
VQALSILVRGSIKEKLQWIFRFYDIDNDGKLTKHVCDRFSLIYRITVCDIYEILLDIGSNSSCILWSSWTEHISSSTCNRWYSREAFRNFIWSKSLLLIMYYSHIIVIKCYIFLLRHWILVMLELLTSMILKIIVYAYVNNQ